MEERIIDGEEGRKITVKRTSAGGIHDAVEEGVEPAAQEEEEIILELPEEEYDEDLVGLTPSQLQKALEEKKRIEQAQKEERDKMLSFAQNALKAGSFSDAETYFVQALVYDPESVEAKNGIWIARTKDFSDTEVLYEKSMRTLLNNADDETKSFLRSRIGDKLFTERAGYKSEAEPLAERLSAARATRREAFRQNKMYYLIRFCILLGIGIAYAIASLVSALFIVRTQSTLPIILTGVFAGVSFIFFMVVIFFGRKLYTASSLCRNNEKLSSTEDGARLEYLQNRIEVLDLILED